MENSKKIHHIFWTGGLDSSFRVIHLLRSTDDLVQPHYVIRHEESTGHEVNAMNNIRRAITREMPDKRPNLLPTIYVNEDLIPESKDVSDAVEAMRKELKGVHEQYEILARYCKASAIEEIELTYERAVGGPIANTTGVAKHFGRTYPFDNFLNPHIDITKPQCYAQARAEGWDNLLTLTSFCRRPGRKGKPCGTCGPCHDAYKTGLGFRLPFRSRVKAAILKPCRKYYRKHADMERKNWFFRLIRKAFEDRL